MKSLEKLDVKSKKEELKFKNENCKIIFDVTGKYSPNKNKPFYLLYPHFESSSFEQVKHYQEKLLIIQDKLSVDKLFVPNFKYIGPKTMVIDLNKQIYHYSFNPDVWYGDGVIVIKNNLLYEKIAVWWFVGDCAAIIMKYKNEMIWILHAGWPWTTKWVVSHYINLLKEILWDNGSQKSLNELRFFVSPMAWNDFELPTELVKNNFEDFIKRNKVSYSHFFKVNNYKPSHWFLDLRKAIKIEFQNQWIDTVKQIWFHPDNTTDISNGWPSYRLFSKKIYSYDDRLAAFGII